ncbi:MAG: nucleotidyltransferase domain-containing protein [Flavobacteriales bacterium]
MHTLKPLLYFSLFRHPLTEKEIYAFSEEKSPEKISAELHQLMADKIVFKNGEFYTLVNNNTWIERRIKGNQKAKDIHPKAIQVSRFISKFPYIEGVGISGSLSKGYYDEDSDFDFFIITKHQRLWIARTFLILYKKIFLLNSRKYFCVNYFISENDLEIEEKNRFTATELVTLMPMYGNGSFHEFYQKNKWTKGFLPNKKTCEALKKLNPIEKPFVSKLLEKILNTKLGDVLDHLFLKITLKKWKSKFKNMNKKQFAIALKSNQNVSKHHPLNFQRQVIEQLNNKYDEIKEKYNIHIAKEYA